MTSFSDLDMRRWWTPEDREAVRAVNAEHWPAVRDALLSRHPPGTALTDVPEFCDALRDFVVHDGWGVEDVAVWFGVSRERARQWTVDVLSPLEVDERGPTCWRVWALDRFVPTTTEEARDVYSRSIDGPEDRRRNRRQSDVAALRAFVRDFGRVPRTGEFAETLGESYQVIGARWPGTYAEGWDALYRAAGYERPGAYDVEKDVVKVSIDEIAKSG